MKIEDFEKAKRIQERIEEFKKFKRAIADNRLCIPIKYTIYNQENISFYPDEEHHFQNNRFKELIDIFIMEYEEDLKKLGIE